MIRFRLRSITLLCLVGIGVGLPSIGHSGQTLLDHSYRNAGRTKVTVDSVFGVAARNGALPYRVTIHNDTGEDRRWTIQIVEGSRRATLRTETSSTIEVPAGSTTEHELLFRFSPSFVTHSYRNPEITVSSPGFDTISRSHSYQTVSTIPTIAMSSKLAARSQNVLDKAVRDRNSDDQRFADSFDPKQLPSDWRALTGLDVLLVDREAWRELQEIQRRAILEWVRLGGTLDIYASEQDFPEKSEIALLESLGISGLSPVQGSDNFARLSLGKVQARFWNGTSLDRSDATKYSNLPSHATELEDHFDGAWSLADRFGIRKFNGTFVFLVLLAFAVLVAPINLFVFAKPGKRHRLFVTTPLISLGACILVVIFIFVSDGLGGRGYRIAFADLQADAAEMRLYVSQEQVSRTGVMIRTGFENPERPILDPANLRSSTFNLLDSGSGASLAYRFSGESFLGDFFRSRSEQGFSIQSVVPTRSRIEVSAGPDGKPKLTSNLPVSIERLVYRDDWGAVWQTPEGQEPIAPGSEIPLEPISDEAAREWINGASFDFSSGMKTRIRGLMTAPNRFFALSHNPDALFVETHPSINWEEETLLLSGNAVERGKGSDPES